MVKVKICGITRMADALLAAALGADYLGFNFYPPSPRYVEPALVREILSELSSSYRVRAVGVFVNENAETIRRVAAESGIRTAQLHGDETPEFCRGLGLEAIKVLRVAGEADVAAAGAYAGHTLLVDSKTPQFGGSGVRPDWALAEKICRRHPQVLLAGGLTPENVAEAIRIVRPWGVDVSSGVESEPGTKDPDKLKAFLRAVVG